MSTKAFRPLELQLNESCVWGGYGDGGAVMRQQTSLRDATILNCQQAEGTGDIEEIEVGTASLPPGRHLEDTSVEFFKGLAPLCILMTSHSEPSSKQLWQTHVLLLPERHINRFCHILKMNRETCAVLHCIFSLFTKGCFVQDSQRTNCF